MNEFKMSLFLAPISPVKDGGTGQIIKPATLKPYKTMTLQANHNTPYSAGLIKGVLTDMIACTKELILDGKNVKLDDLAIFSVGIVSRKGAASADAFTLADNVKGLKLRARATGELSNAQINLEGQLKEASKYSPDNSGAGGSTPGGGNGEEENPLG